MDASKFWSTIDGISQELGIKRGTVQVWKHRARLPKSQILPIYQALLGTEKEISLTDLDRAWPIEPQT